MKFLNKECSRCGEIKELSSFVKHAHCKYGVRSECKDCTKILRKIKQQENPYKHRLRTMSSTILKRMKYCGKKGYEHLNCYIGISCELGDTIEEIMKVLDDNFKEDILELIDSGKTPSVDRINSSDNYRLGNIRILDSIENGKLGFKNANEVRKIKVKAIYPNGEIKLFDSIRDAAKYTNLHHGNIRGLIDRKGISRKEKIKFEEV